MPQQGGCGEIRTVAVELNYTKGSDHRDVDWTSPQTPHRFIYVYSYISLRETVSVCPALLHGEM